MLNYFRTCAEHVSDRWQIRSLKDLVKAEQELREISEGRCVARNSNPRHKPTCFA